MPHTHLDDDHASPVCPAQIVQLHEPMPALGQDELWDQLREQHGPVVPVELEPGVRAWLLLGYQESLGVLQSPHMFSRDTRRWRAVAEGRVNLSRPTFSWRPNALYADGAVHTRLRTPIVDSLSRIDMAAAERTVRRIAHDLVDSFVANGSADLISEYADPLPVLVINRLYGLPDSYGHMLGDLTGTIFDEDPERGEDAVARIHQYFTGLVDRKRKNPGHDLVSWMLQHPVGLDDDEVAHQAALVSNASHQPTTHLIGNTLWTLLSNPRVRAAHTDARLSVQELLDHVMWRNTPFQILLGRIALQDVRIGRATIRAGDALLIGLGPAHRDPTVQKGHDDSDTGLTDGSRAHLVFGAGPHSCPAQEQARLIAATGISVLHERLSGLQAAVPLEDLRWNHPPLLRGLRTLPVTFLPDEPLSPRQKVSDAPEVEEVPASEADTAEGDVLGRLLNWWRNLRF